MELNLRGKTVLITGGSKGIGKAVAEVFVEEGADVHLVARDAATLAATADELRDGHQANVTTSALDLSDSANIPRLQEVCPTPDILVNNAGLNRNSAFADIDLADFDAINRINLRTPVALMQAVLPAMQQNGWGRVINIGSIWSKLARPGRASYAASKFGLDGVTAATAAEAAADGVMINMVSPGIIDTELTRRTVDPDRLKALLADVPAGRLGQPKEIAAFVAWLAGPENTFISGQNIAIDGGFTRV